MKTKKNCNLMVAELVSIGGKFNHVENCMRDGKKYKIYYWWKTVKGTRAGEWTSLLVTADKAMDLGCEVAWGIHDANYRRSWSRRYRVVHKFIPCSQDKADTVCIWVEQI